MSEAGAGGGGPDVAIESLDVSAYTIPTATPESDGTLEWDSTTMVLVEAHAGGRTGLGYSYTHAAAASLISAKLAGVVTGLDAMDVPAAFHRMWHEIRNIGRPGLVSSAMAAVDFALWDLKARLLDLPLVTLLGRARERIPVYGSGGFTSYTDAQLREQLGGWAEEGIGAVKMKVGREPERDPHRVRVAREAVGAGVELYTDANGAWSRKEALLMAERFAEQDVSWLEEPVSSDDLAGLRLLRDRGPAGMRIAAGEYGYDIFYFRRMLEAEAVDVLQADATRCGGATGFLRVAPLCAARALPLSAHTAPSLHGHLCCVAPEALNVEYFFDHVRIESMLFDGALVARDGALVPDLGRPGLGLELRRADAARYAVT